MRRRDRQSRLPTRWLAGGIVAVWLLAVVAVSSPVAADWLRDVAVFCVGVSLFAAVSWAICWVAARILFWPTEHRQVVARRRARAGRCPECDYDLRVETARCPECGWRRPVPADEYAARLHRWVSPPDASVSPADPAGIDVDR